MFAGLPKLADRNFVVGFLLPTLVAAVATLFLFRGTPLTDPIYDDLFRQKSFTDLTLVALGVWTIATLLVLVNNGVYRLLEGYVGPFDSKAWRRRMRRRYSTELRSLKRTNRRLGRGTGKATDALRRDYAARNWRFAERFPHERQLVLPTRFGNVIRAFEMYPTRVYGVDAIPAWLRLAGVVPKDFASMIADARAEVNFFVNLWLLSILFVVLALGRCTFDLWRMGQPALANLSWGAPLAAIVAIGLAALAYEGAVERAVAWGGMVKSAFDLYLPALAEQMGYGLPMGQMERRSFWDEVNSLFLYRVPIRAERWPPHLPPEPHPEHTSAEPRRVRAGSDK